MSPRDDSSSPERRRAARRSAQGTVKVVLPASELRGRIDDVSASGVLFLSGDALHVSIEIEEDGVSVQRKGRLVRAQRMSAETIGWAVEFDPR